MTAGKLIDRGEEGKALKTYLMLIGVAANRGTIRYKAIVDALGFPSTTPGHRAAEYLRRIYHGFTVKHGLPDLTTIVVAETGEPGGDHVHGPDLYRERERVYGLDWTDWTPPTLEELQTRRPSL